MELCHCQQGRKERCNEWTDKGDVVESKRDHAPLDRELQAGDPGEGPDEQAGHDAHLRSDKQIFSKFDGRCCAAIHKDPRRIAIGECIDLAGKSVISRSPRMT